jgi:hypothetical protein
MQFIEYNLWNNLHNPTNNRFWSQMGQYLVWAEMFGSANVIQEPFMRNIFFGLSTFYIALQTIFSRKTINLTTVGPNGHLVHDWYTDIPLFNRLLPLLLILPLWIQGETVFAVFLTLTAIISAFYYTTGEFSSMWCYLTTFFWVIVIYQSIGLDEKCVSWFK